MQTKLPLVLASEFMCDFVEEIPCDIRWNNLAAIERVLGNPEKFPDADFAALEAKSDAINDVMGAWLYGDESLVRQDEEWQHA